MEPNPINSPDTPSRGALGCFENLIGIGFLLFLASFGLVYCLAMRDHGEWIKNDGFLMGVALEFGAFFGIIMIPIGIIGAAVVGREQPKCPKIPKKKPDH